MSVQILQSKLSLKLMFVLTSEDSYTTNSIFIKCIHFAGDDIETFLQTNFLCLTNSNINTCFNISEQFSIQVIVVVFSVEIKIIQCVIPIHLTPNIQCGLIHKNIVSNSTWVSDAIDFNCSRSGVI